MDENIFAEWMARQGYRVVRTASSYWAQVTTRIYQAFPYHCTIEPRQTELKQLFQRHRALALRYSAPFNSQSGIASYHVIYQGKDYSLSSLPRQSRKNVLKAMKEIEFKPVSFSLLASAGWPIRAETLKRQGRSHAENRNWWHKLCFSAEGLKGFEAWGAIIKGNLIASLITFTCRNCCSILYQQSKTEYLSSKVNNLLVFALTSEVLKRPEVGWIFSGMQSLDAPSSLDDFKFRMNYFPKPVRQKVIIHPLMEPFFNSLSYSFVKWLKRRKPKSPKLSKAEGIIRFFIEGQRPLNEQTWPPQLERRREELINMVS